MDFNPVGFELMVVFGGRSGEHEVSLKSAVSIIDAARTAGFKVTPVGIGRDGVWRAIGAGAASRIEATKLPAAVLKKGRKAALVPSSSGPRLITLQNGSPICRPSAAFPVLHGTYGEDGTIQGLFEMCGLAYAGPGVLGSALAMDKVIAKRVLRDAGLDVVPFVTWMRTTPINKAVKEVEKTFKYPVFVKPANMGSSVGIGKAADRKALLKAMAEAAKYDRKVLVESAVNAREIECAVLGYGEFMASVPGEVIPVNEFYDYEAKYLKDGSRTEVPADLPKAISERVRKLALEAFEALSCEGMARVDFFLERKTSRLFINELNTIPGFTSISMYPMMWMACGVPYPDLVTRLVSLAVERFKDVSGNTTIVG